MKTQATLRDTRDGFSRVIEREFRVGDVWYWTEGNGSCDCNRFADLYGDDETKALDCNTGDNVIVLDRLVIDGNSVPLT